MRQVDGSPDRQKACWVLRGFTQCPGVNYDETFSLVVKPATVHTILTLAHSHLWSIHQLDVKNVFLHGTLTKTVYCSQPAGLLILLTPTWSAKSTSLSMVTSRLLAPGTAASLHTCSSLGFVEAKSDTSLFIYRCGSETMHLLLYVDDIVFMPPLRLSCPYHHHASA